MLRGFMSLTTTPRPLYNIAATILKSKIISITKCNHGVMFDYRQGCKPKFLNPRNLEN